MHRFTPSLDTLEGRITLSTLTTPAYLGAKALVNRAVALARSGDLDRAEAIIARAASRIPLSDSALLPVWRSELATVSRQTPGSALQAKRDIFLALDTHLNRGVEVGAITVRGSASRQVSRPVVQSLNGYTAFSNSSQETLVVTVSRDGDVFLRSLVTSGETLRFKPPVEALPIRPVYTLSASKLDGSSAGRVEISGLGNEQIVATDSPVRGEIEFRVFQDRF